MTKSELPVMSAQEMADQLGDALEGGPCLGLDLIYYCQDLYRRHAALEVQVADLKQRLGQTGDQAIQEPWNR